VSSTSLNYLGPYRLLNVVHTGQTSQIWQAMHDGSRQFFAVKTLLDEFQRQPEHVHYLKWEYTVGSKMDHERIVRMHDYQTVRGTPYLAMEWFAWPNLKQRIRQGIESYAHLVPKIIRQSAEAISHLNEQGWVHRDIKPDNLMVTDDGDVKLIDFALAQRTKGVLGKLLRRKSKVQGTRSYISPEQIRGQPLDGRADLYSFACTVFELLTGRVPFTGTTANELLTKHLRASPPSVVAANRNVTLEFAELLRRSMAKAPSARPESVGGFLAEFDRMRVFRQNPPPPKKAKEAEDRPPIQDPPAEDC